MIKAKHLANNTLWKHQRFYVELTGDSKWPFNLVDNKWGVFLEFDNEKEALNALKFSKIYVKRWKDINIIKFPKNITEKPKKFNRQDLKFLQTDNIRWLAK